MVIVGMFIKIDIALMEASPYEQMIRQSKALRLILFI